MARRSGPRAHGPGSHDLGQGPFRVSAGRLPPRPPAPCGRPGSYRHRPGKGNAIPTSSPGEGAHGPRAPPCAHCQHRPGLLLSAHARPVTASPPPLGSCRRGSHARSPGLSHPPRDRHAAPRTGRRHRPQSGDRLRATPSGPAGRGVGRPAGPAAIRAGAPLDGSVGRPRARAWWLLDLRGRRPRATRAPVFPGQPPKSTASPPYTRRPVIARWPIPSAQGATGRRPDAVRQSTDRGWGDSGHPGPQGERGAWQG